MAAKRLVTFAPAHAALVFEALTVPQPRQGAVAGQATRRRLALWPRQVIRQAANSKAQAAGLVVAEVNPADTSQTCSRCGLRGQRKRHAFTCHSCGHSAHADVNAAVHIRNRSPVLRAGGLPARRP
jgi:IS605 OrfB family transposase